MKIFLLVGNPALFPGYYDIALGFVIIARNEKDASRQAGDEKAEHWIIILGNPTKEQANARVVLRDFWGL